MEELDLQDTMVTDFTEPSMEGEQTGADPFVRSLLMDMEGLAGGLMEEEKARKLRS